MVNDPDGCLIFARFDSGHVREQPEVFPIEGWCARLKYRKIKIVRQVGEITRVCHVITFEVDG